MKCKFCNSGGSLDLELKGLKPYSMDSNGQFQPCFSIEGRGWEPIEWVLGAPFKGSGLTGMPFIDIDLTDREWADYDEKAAVSVEIMEIETKITRPK